MSHLIRQAIHTNQGDVKSITMLNGYKSLVVLSAEVEQVPQPATDLTRSNTSKTIKYIYRLACIQNSKAQSFDNITFAKYVIRFLARKRDNVKSSTYTIYETMLKKHAIPHIGHFRMRDITTAHINTTLLNEHKLKPTTRKLLKAVLSTLCNSAYREGLITNNPVRYSDRILGEQRKVDLLLPTEAEMNLLLTTLKKEQYLLYVLVLTTIHSGLRKGELQGLKWTSLNLEQSVLKIRTQKNSYGADISLKTSSSIRDVHINPSVMQTILSLPRTDEYIFPVNTHHYWLLKRYFLKVGFHERMTFHDLRHYHATLLMKKGVNIKIISKRLGHKDVQTTLNIYTHHESEMDRQVVNLLGDTHII